MHNCDINATVNDINATVNDINATIGYSNPLESLTFSHPKIGKIYIKYKTVFFACG